VVEEVQVEEDLEQAIALLEVQAQLIEVEVAERLVFLVHSHLVALEALE
jgi:hypothetical protein